jgi:hypothetical protein
MELPRPESVRLHIITVFLGNTDLEKGVRQDNTRRPLVSRLSAPGVSRVSGVLGVLWVLWVLQVLQELCRFTVYFSHDCRLYKLYSLSTLALSLLFLSFWKRHFGLNTLIKYVSQYSCQSCRWFYGH